MEYNLRPQWRQWTYITSQNPTCGRCGLSHAISMCYAVRRQCFKCRNYGHYGRMCKTLPTVHTRRETIQELNQKSTGKKVRDSLRMSLYLERKRSMRELPFSSLRPVSFRETVLNNNILSDQLLSTKERLSMKCDHLQNKIRNMEGNLQKVTEKLELSQKRESECLENLAKSKLSNEDMIQQLQSAEQKMSILENRNTEITERLQTISQQKIQIPNTDKLITEIADLRKQLNEKDEHCEFLKKFCYDMEFDYEQKLKQEKELTELQKRMRVESEQKMIKQFQDLQTSVQSDLAMLKQQRVNQSISQGHPNDSFMSNQCYLSHTNPSRNDSRTSRYRGRGRF